MEVAVLFADPKGVYSSIPGVDLWDEARDARNYYGAAPVVAHPPCQRWGRFWHGSTRKPHQFKKGDDAGCFWKALQSVRTCGGVLEHPADSHAWKHFGLEKPPRKGGWIVADNYGGFTCCVEQGHYGHFSRKRTWLYAVVPHDRLPELIWGPSPQRLHPIALERYGYEKARRIGMCAMIGGKDKTDIRNATPPEFAAILLSMAKPMPRL